MIFDVRRLWAAFGRRAEPRDSFARGVAALRGGDDRRALAEFDVALRENPDASRRSALHNKRGVALVSLGQRSEALEAFSAALASDERCAPALANIGNLLFEDGDVADAVDYYEAAIRADATYALGHRNLGIALKSLGRLPESVRALRTASRLESRRRSARA